MGEKENKSVDIKKQKIIICALVAIIIIIAIVGVCIYLKFNKKKEENAPIESKWGNTYFEFIKASKNNMIQGDEANAQSNTSENMTNEANNANLSNANENTSIVNDTNTNNVPEETNTTNGIEQGTKVSNTIKKVENNSEISFVNVDELENPVMVVQYTKNENKYSDIYYIVDNKVNCMVNSEPSTIKFLYNINLNKYNWYQYVKTDENEIYSDIGKKLPVEQNKIAENNTQISFANSTKNPANTINEQANSTENSANITNTQANATKGSTTNNTNSTDVNSASDENSEAQADYIIKKDEVISTETVDGKNMSIPKFDTIFVETGIEPNKIKYNENMDDNEIKAEITTETQQYKDNEAIISENENVKNEVSTKVEEVKTKQDEIEKAKEELKQKQEEDARKKAEEEAKKKAEEEAQAKAKAEEEAKKKAEESTKTSTSNRISEAQAKKLAENKMGTKSTETGYPIGYQLEAMVKDSSGLEYYLFRVVWLVENSHWSTIGGIAISVDGKRWQYVDIYNNYKDGDTITNELRGGNF